MNTDRPSKKQRELLSFIDGFIKGNGYGPSYREIMRALNYKSVSTVAVHVEGLIAKGLLIKHGRSARSLEVVTTEEVFQPSATNVRAHEQWLIEKANGLIQSYLSQPSEEGRSKVKALITTLELLGLSQAAKEASQRIAKD